jgi:hypothetical protein
MITPLTEEQLSAISSTADALIILRDVVKHGEKLLHPELVRIIQRCVLVLEEEARRA